jgi:hypothetical protein
VFVCSVIDCGIAAPHAEQTTSGATSTFQAIPSDLHLQCRHSRVGVTMLVLCCWCSVDCGVAAPAVFVLALVLILFFLFAVAAGLCTSSSLYCIFICSVVPVMLGCWTLGFWCFLFGVVCAPVALLVVLKCWSAIFRYFLLQLARYGCSSSRCASDRSVCV